MNIQPKQGAASSGTTETLDEGFVPVVNEPERTSAEGSVIAAYLIMWGVMVFFIWRTLKVQAGLSQETARLLTELEKGKP